MAADASDWVPNTRSVRALVADLSLAERWLA